MAAFYHSLLGMCFLKQCHRRCLWFPLLIPQFTYCGSWLSASCIHGLQCLCADLRSCGFTLLDQKGMLHQTKYIPDWEQPGVRGGCEWKASDCEAKEVSYNSNASSPLWQGIYSVLLKSPMCLLAHNILCGCGEASFMEGYWEEGMWRCPSPTCHLGWFLFFNYSLIWSHLSCLLVIAPSCCCVTLWFDLFWFINVW